MSTSSQAYANLADDAYQDHRPGVFSRESADIVPIGGVDYRIRAHVDNPVTGYQGTVYQRVDTGEMIVAHRGTEFDREAFRDGALADAGMVLGRANLQANDAISLTRQALELVRQDRANEYSSGPVTVTGHSLGGTLAQVSAHHFDLRGETFNAYGAASLNRRIPEGGHSVINHVMAGDVVSAASPHYGEVRVYARQQEIDTLHRNGYDNQTHWSDPLRGYTPLNLVTGTAPPRTIPSAIALGGSHSLHHFTDRDGEGRPDLSVLGDPRARALAQRHSVQIGEYRQDVRQMRGVLTAVSRGISGGSTHDAIDSILGPRPPGVPEQGSHGRQGAALDPASLPSDAQQLLNDSRQQVQQLATRHGLPWDQGMENTVYAVALAAREAGFVRITHLTAGAGGILMAEHDGQLLKEARLDARQAANLPTESAMASLSRALETPAELLAAGPVAMHARA